MESPLLEVIDIFHIYFDVVAWIVIVLFVILQHCICILFYIVNYIESLWGQVVLMLFIYLLS